MSSITYEEANRIITIIHTHLLRFGANQNLCGALLMAKKATEKQIPKKWEPATTEIGMISGKKLKVPDHICPVCEYSLAVDAPYCECCGQRIDWNE